MIPYLLYLTTFCKSPAQVNVAGDFSGTEPPLDLRPVCKFKFVRCRPGEKTRALYLSQLKRGGPMKFENTFFQIAKLRFSGDDFQS